MISMIEAYKMYWKKSFVWRGRATRAEFWWPVLANFLIGFGIGVLSSFLGAFVPILEGILSIFGVLFNLATIFPGLAVLSRRMHDLNKSAWFAFIPYLGLLTCIFMGGFLSGFARGMHSPESTIGMLVIGAGMIFFGVWFLVVYIFTMLSGTPGKNKYDM